MSDYVIRNGIPRELISVVEVKVPADAWTTSSYRLPATPDRPLSIVFKRTDAGSGDANIIVTMKAPLYEAAPDTTSVTMHALAGGLLSKSRLFSYLSAGIPIKTDPPPEGCRKVAFSVWHLFAETKPEPLPPVHLWITFVRDTVLSGVISGSVTAGNPLSSPWCGGSRTFEHYITSENPHDVKFTVEGRDLWASKRTLAGASEHWAAMFSGSWAEGTADTSEHGAPTTLGPLEKTASGTSEAVTDTPKLKEEWPRSNKLITRSVPGQDVTVQCPGFSYNCVKSMLLYLSTGEVTFSIPASPHQQRAPTVKLVSRDASAISAYDMYEVAHFYILPSLQELCIDHIRRCLDIETVAFQLLSPSMQFAEIRQAVCQYIVDNYNAVETTDAWAHVHCQLRDGEESEGAATVVSALACMAMLRVKRQKETCQG